jgi:F0F1-type ATP synthase delta subunit
MRNLKIVKAYAKALLKTAESGQRTEAVYRDLTYLNESSINPPNSRFFCRRISLPKARAAR